jgi:hypothetical protein
MTLFLPYSVVAFTVATFSKHAIFLIIFGGKRRGEHGTIGKRTRRVALALSIMLRCHWLDPQGESEGSKRERASFPLSLFSLALSQNSNNPNNFSNTSSTRTIMSSVASSSRSRSKRGAGAGGSAGGAGGDEGLNSPGQYEEGQEGSSGALYFSSNLCKPFKRELAKLTSL